MKERKNKILIALICVFFISLGLTIAVGFSNQQEPTMLIKSVTPVFDEESTVVVNDDEVIFNDKDQEVKYNVVIENPNNYDVKVSDIVLSTPTEDFLEYEVENLNKDDIINANDTKELVVSFNTVKKEGWGRNFSDALTANISFAKVTKIEEPTPNPEPEEDKEEEKEEIREEEKVEVVAPVKDSNELKEKFELIEEYEIEENEIVFTNVQNVLDKQKIDVWIYSEPIYLGRFEVEVKDGKTKIIGLSEALERSGIEEGNHSLVLQTEAGEKIGYIEVKVDNKKFEKPVQEEIVPDGDVSNKIEDDTYEKEETKEEHQDSKKNKSNALVIVLVIVTGVTGTAIIVILIVNKKKKTVAVIVVLISGISLVKADVLIELPLTFNVSFESQNVMKPSGWGFNSDGEIESLGVDYWFYATQIVDIYINNNIEEINDFDYEFDVSNSQNGRVMAYLVKRDGSFVCMDLEENEAFCYDLYLVSDGIIYANENSSFYFGLMFFLNSINNMEGLDTSNVTDMSFMFSECGAAYENFTLDLGDNFDTSQVTNMTYMFINAGSNSTTFTLDLGDKFDTSKVTNMSSMFYGMASNSTTFDLDLGDKFDTSNVTDMSEMFSWVGTNSTNFTLDLGDKFDTSNVTDMSEMFSWVGTNSTNFTLDLGDKFDTSNVTDMSNMFSYCESMTSSITIKNPNVKLYDSMFWNAATKEGSEIMVNYTDGTSELVDKMIATKSNIGNIVLGIEVGNKCIENGVNTLSDCMLLQDGDYTSVKAAKDAINKKEFLFDETSTTDEGLINIQDEDGDSYLYRGNLNDNFVEFAGYTWRIIRRNGDGSVRIIYNGTSTRATGDDALIGTSVYNLDGQDVAYVGYKYGLDQVLKVTKKVNLTYFNIDSKAIYYYSDNITCLDENKKCYLSGNIINGVWSETYNEILNGNQSNGYVPYKYTCWETQAESGCSVASEILDAVYIMDKFRDTAAKVNYHGYFSKTYADTYVDNIDSTIKKKVDMWYETNIKDSKDASGNNYSLYLSDQTFCTDRSIAYGDGESFERATGYGSYLKSSNPSLSCTRDEDKLKVTNGKLTYPIGLLTLDEIILAGMDRSDTNEGHWLNIDEPYWTMSPAFFDVNTLLFSEWGVSWDGSFNSFFGNSIYGVRPVINLSKDIIITSGSGTASNPYKVSLS